MARPPIEQLFGDAPPRTTPSKGGRPPVEDLFGSPVASTGGRGPVVISRPKDGGDTGSLVGNLGRDLVDIAESLPDTARLVGGAFVKDLPDIFAHGPVGVLTGGELRNKVIVPTAKSYQYQYGPLLGLDFDEFYKRFHANPAGVVLDALTVGTFGAGRVLALAKLPANATKAQVRAALVKGELQGPRQYITAQTKDKTGRVGEPVVVRVLPTKAHRAARVQVTDALLKKLPGGTPGVGEFSRAARATKRGALPVKLTRLHDTRYADYKRAFGALTLAEKAAVNAIARWPNPEDAQLVLARLEREDAHGLTREDSALAQELGNPEVWRHYTERGERVMKADAAAREVVKLREEILLRTGSTTPETLAEAPYRPTRMARGAKFERSLDVIPPERISEGMRVRPADRENVGQIVEVDHANRTAKVFFKNREKGTRATVEFDFGDLLAEGEGQWVGGPSVAELRAEFDAAGLSHPYYVRDIDAPPKGGGMGSGTAGTTPPRKGADVRQSQGILQESGRLLLHPDVTGPAFIRAAKHEWYLRTHELVKRAAVHIPVGEGLPQGMRWVRSVRGEKIPHTETSAGEHMAELEDALRALPEQKGLTLEGDTAEMRAAAEVTEDGAFRLAVPERFARAMDADFKAANRTVDFLERYPMAVWRALVLKVRIPWLVGNIFGNAVLATMRFSGEGGLRAVLGMIRTTRGGEAAVKALREAEEKGVLTADDVARLLPELSRGGTLMSTQLPALGSERLIRFAPTRMEKKLRRAHRLFSSIIDFLPEVDRATEGALRRLGANKVMLASPEVKALVEEGMTPRAAMEHLLDTDPNFRQFVVKEVNDALGDYLSLGRAERTHVRAVIPFYAWFREITRITLRLPLDYPGRVLLLQRLAQVTEEERKERPSFLSGFQATGPERGGIVPGINATPYNPFHSAAESLSALAELGIHPTRRGAFAATGALNPVIQGLIEGLGNAAQARDAGKLGALPEAVWKAILELPESRLLLNPPSKIEPERTQSDLARRFFGDPSYRPDASVMRRYAREGR